MRLHGLLPLLRDTPSYAPIATLLQQPSGTHSVRLDEDHLPLLVAALHSGAPSPLCVIVADPERAARLAEETRQWVEDPDSVVRLPEPDFPRTSVDTSASDGAIARTQVATTLALREKPFPQVTFVCSVLALLGALPEPSTLTSATVDLTPGITFKPDDLMFKLQSMGYERVEYATRTGEMSRRGGILDVFSPAHDEPVRIEFFGNEIESVRFYDAESQLTIGQARGARATALRSGKAEATLLEYLPEDATILVEDPRSLRLRSLRLQAEMAEYVASVDETRDLPVDESVTPLVEWPRVEHQIERFRRLQLQPFGQDEEESQGTPLLTTAPNYAKRLPDLLNAIPKLIEENGRVVLVSHQARRIADLLEERGQPVPVLNDLDAPPAQGSLSLVQGSIRRGCVIPRVLTLLSDYEMFGFVKHSRRPRKPRVRTTPFAMSFKPGDVVVHVDHGIGRFVGLTRLTTGEIEHEYAEVTYLGGDTLYVPTDQIGRLTRYAGGGESPPRLSKLGSTEWETTKQRVRQSTKALAQELVKLYALRQLAEGYSYEPDGAWQQELEASFPYMETPDQLEAIDAVKTDMESTRPMDRLICGDVGYGKTEIALRAAFKAVMDGKQVALLTPTTVLAQQHHATFTERLSAYPVTIASLSRFTPAGSEEEILLNLASGHVDICIGTHRLLQKDIAFRDLGLLIVDEEQRFGVMQKESLRNLRVGLDTLTLSATPIPRTLHMALTGIRDMSTMETPPEDRLAVRTHVGPYDQALTRQAILREIERNGQAFFVHNRIANIQAVARVLQETVPEARMGIAHGRMREDELEKTMTAFADGEIDVLVCTTIVQLGLDMPNANTLIVHQAERLGLTQLYQLRGRVGRGRNQAYAYFFHDRHKELTQQARRRLSTIYEANELGAGLEIALRDLEIRGAGSLLGTRQSGHIAAVGFELYCQILAEEVEQLQAEQGEVHEEEKKRPAVSLDLPVTAHIPEAYVASPATRITLYRKLADVASLHDLKRLEEEMEDRFGTVPSQVKELLWVARVRILAQEAGVTSITRMGSDIVIVPGRMDALSVHLDLGPAVKVGNTQIRINTTRIGNKWRRLLDMLLTPKTKGTP